MHLFKKRNHTNLEEVAAVVLCYLCWLSIEERMAAPTHNTESLQYVSQAGTQATFQTSKNQWRVSSSVSYISAPFDDSRTHDDKSTARCAVPKCSAITCNCIMLTLIKSWLDVWSTDNNHTWLYTCQTSQHLKYNVSLSATCILLRLFI